MKNLTPLKFFQVFLVSLITISAFSQVGIDTTDPKTTLDINGSMSLRDGGVLSMTNGNNNDVSLGTDPHSVYRIQGPTSSFVVTGIVPITGADGQMVTLVNTTDQSMTIRHNSVSAASRRILCPGAQNLTVTGQYSTVTLIYNATERRWYITDYVSKRYGDNMQYAVGTSDIATSSSTFVDMADMSITFTPNHSVVFVTFGASGNMDLTGLAPYGAYGHFRLVNVTAGNTSVAATATLATDFDYDDATGLRIGTAWNASINNFPVTVTPGQSTTLKIQWLRNGLFATDLQNWVTTLPEGSHRNMTIMD